MLAVMHGAFAFVLQSATGAAPALRPAVPRVALSPRCDAAADELEIMRLQAQLAEIQKQAGTAVADPAAAASTAVQPAASTAAQTGLESAGIPSLPSLPSLPTSLPAVPEVDSAVVTDTALDVLVYALLAGVAGLTLYSIVVTLQASNDQYGGWTKQDDDDVAGGMLEQPSNSLVSGARYDPVTESWTYPTPEEQAAKAKVGRAPAPAEDTANRYERRMAKKQKKKKR